MTKYIWATDAFNHATEVYPQECCGLIIDLDGVQTYWKCKNISQAYKEKSFVIDLAFSHTDRMACKYLDLPFYLVEPKSESIIVVYPSEIND